MIWKSKHPVPGRYAYSASYGAGTSGEHAVTIRAEHAAVTMALRGFYETIRRGSTVVHLYHRARRVKAAVKVRPDGPGECVRLDLQEYYKGKWHPRLRTSCAPLNRKSNVTVSLPANKEALRRLYRIRAAFCPGRDTTINSAHSAWQYVMIKR